jgi:hypothetical protein
MRGQWSQSGARASSAPEGKLYGVQRSKSIPVEGIGLTTTEAAIERARGIVNRRYSFGQKIAQVRSRYDRG